MRNSIGILVCTLLMVSFSSCKKKETNSELRITGNIIDPNLGTAVSGVSVKLSVQEITGGVWSSGYRNLGTMNTGSEGTYDFTFEKPNAVEYKVEYEKSGYFETQILIDPEQVTPDNIYHSTNDIYTKSYLNVHYKNISPVDNLDELRFHQVAGANDCSSCCTGTQLFLYGENVDTTTTCLLYGGQYAKFNYWVTKNNNVTFYSDSIYCAPFDTAFYQVQY